MGVARVRSVRFSGTTEAYYRGRGWYDGTADITTSPDSDGYKFEVDGTLGRNVMYVHWVTKTSYIRRRSRSTWLRLLRSWCRCGDPASPGTAWRFQIDSSFTRQGATAYILFKTHNIIGSPWGGHQTRFGRGDSTPQVHNDGQTDLDFVGVRENSVPQTYDPATGQRLGRSRDSTFMVSIRDDWHWV